MLTALITNPLRHLPCPNPKICLFCREQRHLFYVLNHSFRTHYVMALSGLDASTLDYHMSMLIRTMGTIRFKENIIKIKKKIFKSRNRNYFNKKNLNSLW